jgi:DNA-binding CsgD family transcriptional regulator
MPRAPRFATAAVGEFFRQLRYAPVEARCRLMDAAEGLAGEIDPARSYPQEFVVYRVTGYRPDLGEDPVMVVGEPLRRDLVSLVQQLSRTVRLPAGYRDREAVSLPEICRRLSISPKTLQRYRRQGLICHYVCDPGGRHRLVCFADALDRFVGSHRRQVGRAATFSRIGAGQEAEIVAAAAALRAVEPLSLNEAARRLARQFGRAHETVRALLRRHDRRVASSIFAEHGPLTRRDRQLLLRAWQRGIGAALLARRFGKTVATIHRAVNRSRGERLAALDLQWVSLPTLDLPEAEAVILYSPVACRDLPVGPAGGDVLEMIETAHGDPAGPDDDREDALIAAFNLLKRRARQGIDGLAPWPSSSALDAIETDLRWAALLKRRLVGLGLPAAVRTIEQHLHRRLGDEPAETVLRLVELALEVISRRIEGLDPSRGQRLERVVSHGLDRALAATSPVSTSGRAAARHLPGSMWLSAAQGEICPWQAWLDLPARRHAHLDTLEPPIAELIRSRYGLAGTRPMTLAELAAAAATTPGAMAARIRRAERRMGREARRHEGTEARSGGDHGRDEQGNTRR